MSQSVAGRVMPMIVVGSVDAIRNFIWFYTHVAEPTPPKGAKLV